MGTFAVTCRAGCIRLLVDRDMNICHEVRSLSTSMQPHTVYSKHNELLQSCYWKFEVNPTYGVERAHCSVIFVPVTQHLGGHQLYSKKNVGAYFLPWQFKNLATWDKYVRCCVVVQTVVTVKWNYCASFCVFVTVIQIVSVTEGTELLQQSSLAFHCHICCFISWLEVKFPYHVTLVQLWNSTYVVLIVKCVFILRIVCFLSFWDSVHSGGKSVWYQMLCDNIYCCTVIQFSQCDFAMNISFLNNFWYEIWGADSCEDL